MGSSARGQPGGRNLCSVGFPSTILRSRLAPIRKDRGLFLIYCAAAGAGAAAGVAETTLARQAVSGRRYF